MRRDSIFYRLFQQYPALLFELLANPPEDASKYRFDSVAVKEPRFEIDGVFLPPENNNSGTVYFCEVQFQKDDKLYERVFAELFLYFYRNRHKFSNWEAVIIYPNRNTEQNETTPYNALLNSEQVHRIYLDELGDIRQLPLEIAVMLLTTVDKEQAPVEARHLLRRTQREVAQPSTQAIIELITTIVMYKFEQLSQKEVEEMLGITLKETRVYREIKEEGRQEGERALIFRLLTKRVGELSSETRSQIESLSLEQLENLGEALLDFNSMTDLQAWLKIHAN